MSPDLPGGAPGAVPPQQQPPRVPPQGLGEQKQGRADRDQDRRDRDGRDGGDRRDGHRDRDHKDRDDHREPRDDHHQDDRKDRDQGADRESDRDADGEAKRERAEREQRQGERFRDAMQDPRAEEGTPGGARAATRARRDARVRFDVRGNSSVFDRSRFGHAHFGDVYVGAATTTGVAVFGTVPEDELQRLRKAYCPPADYGTLKDALRNRRVLVLGGPPSSGRFTTGLCLLDELTEVDEDAPEGATGGRVSRLDAYALTDIMRKLETLAERIPHGGGLIVQLPEVAGDWLVPQELHLDALSAALAKLDAFAVLVASPSSPGGPLLTGRYGRQCLPAPARELLSWHLVRGLAEGADGADALDRGDRILGHPLFQQALGLRLDALRPAETEVVARLVVRHISGELTREALLDACGEVARGQAREWFAPTDAAVAPIGAAEPGRVDGMDSRLREAAFRIALAVLDGEALSAVADASDLLAWEFLIARDPERAHGRPVLTENLEGLLASCRADLDDDEDESLGGVPLPVRTVGYRGTALAGAVLAEVWNSHHAARAPIVRWLRALADDRRPQVWTRAAVTAGELCTADMGYGFAELIRPLAAASTARRRFFAATALDQAGRRKPYSTAVAAVVQEWADAAEAGLRWTAALVLGSGRATDSTRSAVDLLGRIGTRDDGQHLQVASFGLARLAAGSRAGEVLTTLGEWATEVTGEYRDLALLTTIRVATARTDEFWEPEGPTEPDAGEEAYDGGETAAAGRQLRLPSIGTVKTGHSTPMGGWHPHTVRPPVARAATALTDAELDRRSGWPLALALAVAVPGAVLPLTGLLWRALDSHLAGQGTLDGVRDWLRVAEADAALPGAGRRYAFEEPEAAREASAGLGEILRALLWFLPYLLHEERDWQRLDWVLTSMAADSEEPMTERFGRHVLDTLVAGARAHRGEQR